MNALHTVLGIALTIAWTFTVSAQGVSASPNTLMKETFRYMSDVMRWSTEMMTASPQARDSLQRLIEQRSEEFERRMEQFNAQVEGADTLDEEENGDDERKFSVKLELPPDNRNSEDDNDEETPSKRRWRISFDVISSVEGGKSLALHNGSLSYNGPHAAVAPLFNHSGTFGMDFLSLNFAAPSRQVWFSLGGTHRSETHSLPSTTRFIPDPNRLRYRTSDTAFDKVLLKGAYWGVPLMLHVRPVRRSDFYLAFGAEAAFLTKTTATYFLQKEEENYSETLNIRDERTFALNPVHIGLRFRIGYNPFYGFAQYSLTPIYKTTGDIPAFHTFGFGVGFLFSSL